MTANQIIYTIFYFPTMKHRNISINDRINLHFLEQEPFYLNLDFEPTEALGMDEFDEQLIQRRNKN